MGEQPDRAVAVLDDALVDALGGHLAEIALHRAQNVDPLLDELIGREGLVPGALQTDELGDVLKVLPENVVLTLRDYRRVANTQGEQLFKSAGIIQYVDHDVVYAPPRKKLFRPETTASPGLREENELVGRAHGFK